MNKDRCDKPPRIRTMASVFPPIGGGVTVASGAAVSSTISSVPLGMAFVISALAAATILFPSSQGPITVNAPAGNTVIELPVIVNGPPLVTSTATSIVWLTDFVEP